MILTRNLPFTQRTGAFARLDRSGFVYQPER